MSDSILFDQDGAIVTVTMNRPDIRNAITDDDMLDGLEDAFRRVNADKSVAVMILTGVDPAFCAGGNVIEMAKKTGAFGKPANELREWYRAGIQRVPRLLWDLECPAIAAVNGAATGAGCDLTTMCDIRIASEKARFAETFVKLGLIPGDGGAWLLPKTIGLSRAAEMTFTGEMIDATTASEWGLVSRVVPHGELMSEARALAERIATNSIPALRMAKKLMREGMHTRLDTLLELSAAIQISAHETEEYERRINAMADRVSSKS